MNRKILYFGSELDVIQSVFTGTVEAQQPDLFTTARIDGAINELLNADFDCFLVEEPRKLSDFRLLLCTARIIDDHLTIVCRRREKSRVTARLAELIDRLLEPHEGIDLDLLRADSETSPPRHSLGPHPILESLKGNKPQRALAHIDRDGSYRWANERLMALLEDAADDIEGVSVDERLPKGANRDLARLVRKAIETGCVQWTGADVEPFDRIFCIYPIDEESVLLVTHSPESTLAFGEQYLNRLTDLFFLMDPDGGLVYWNNRLNDVTGYSDAELLEMTAFDLILEEDHQLARKKLQDIVADGDQSAEFRLLTKEGDSIPYQFSGSRIDGTDDEPRYVCGIGRDISHRVAMREKIETVIKQLEESNADLERFAYVASHDLREPLRMVRSYLELLQQRYGTELDQDAKEFIEFAVDGAERMQSMINDLLEYSRVGIEVRDERVDCNEVLDDVRSNLRVTITESNAELLIDELPVVAADRTLLVQLFQNIIANAIQHSGAETPRIHVSAERSGVRWSFAITDSNGQNQDLDEDVFELFSRSSDSEGWGIGLATCRKIVEMFGGEIAVDSSEDGGSTFRFTLPAPDGRTSILGAMSNS